MRTRRLRESLSDWYDTVDAKQGQARSVVGGVIYGSLADPALYGANGCRRRMWRARFRRRANTERLRLRRHRLCHGFHTTDGDRYPTRRASQCDERGITNAQKCQVSQHKSGKESEPLLLKISRTVLITRPASGGFGTCKSLRDRLNVRTRDAERCDIWKSALTLRFALSR